MAVNEAIVSSLEAAREYLRRGCRPVPVPRGEKRPRLKNWTNLSLSEGDLPEHFNGDVNIGLLLGEPSGGLVDVDLDCRQAVLAASIILMPRTGMIHGRDGAPCSHWYYISQPAPAPAQFHDIDGNMLLELRSTGQQTLVPPSLHPKGDILRWEFNGPPLSVECEALRNTIAKVAAATLLARHWPAQGSRHRAALALAGMLLRAEWGEGEIVTFVTAVSKAAADEELKCRVGDVISTERRLGAGRAATGAPTLAQIMGEEVVRRVREWLGLGLHVEVAKPYPVDARRWPEALAPEAFQGLAGDFVRSLDPCTEADPAATLFQFLIAFGSVVGNNPRFMVGATAHHLNEFLLIVGRSAKSRKGTSLGEVRGVFRDLGVDDQWERSRVLPGLSSGEGVIYHVRDEVWGRNKKGEKVLVDEGVADKRLLIVEAEFASVLRVLQRDGNTLSGVLRCAWDGVPLGTLTKNSPLRATQSHISIIGHTTQEDLLRYLSATEQANGFANRFMIGCAQRSKKLPEGGTLPEDEARRLHGKVRAAVEFARVITEIRRSPEAGEVWRAVYSELTNEDIPGLFGALTARAEAHVLRFSMIYALLDRSTEVRPEHIQAALAVWEYCEGSVRYLFGDATGDPLADAILQALRENPSGLTRTEISNFLGRHKNAEAIDRALALLQRLNRAHPLIERTDGRPVERWLASTGAAK
jgi:hypothetical protein